jgi:hypothetical protein
MMLFIGTEAGLLAWDGLSPALPRMILAGRRVVALEALDAATLVVGCGAAGGWMTFDGGASWHVAPRVPQPPGVRVVQRQGLRAVALPRLSGATAYAALEGRAPALLGAGAAGAQLFRSEDGGIHWQAARMPAERIGAITCLAPSGDDPSTAWAGSTDGVLLQTRDAGRSWALAWRGGAPVLVLAAAPG